MFLRKLTSGFTAAIAPPYQFRLRSVLVAMAFLSILLAWWRDHARLKHEMLLIRSSRASWSVAQLIGEPNTHGYGDIGTAWASASQDGQTEWLQLTYDKPVTPKAVLIHETYNPGAVFKITSLNAAGIENVLWTGTDPTPQKPQRGVSNIPIKTNTPIDRIRVYLDSMNVPGWNEIDAVGIVTAKGETVWAIDAKASSSYAARYYGLPGWSPF